MLEQEYNVKNFAVAGSGPEYSLSILLKNILDKTESELKNITVFFIMSHDMRFNLLSINPYDQVLCKYTTFNMFDPRITDYAKNKLNSVIDKPMQKFIKKFYNYYFSNLNPDIHILKTVGSLQLLANVFNKILVVSSFKKIPPYIPDKDNNFSLFSRMPLSDLMKQQFAFDHDKLSNHLEDYQHPVFYEQLKNWIEFDIPVDFDKIKDATHNSS